MPNKNARMALVYDFDGTLAPGNLQENSFIPDVGMKPSDFWDEVDQRAKAEQADRILMYMFLMLDKAKSGKIPVHPEDFKKRGAEVMFFAGVEDWFDRITAYGKSQRVNVEHYIVSSGNAEIIQGTTISSKFKYIYASKFMFDENGVACWPALAVNFTTKTQFLFRINKGSHDISDERAINKFVEMKDRPVPFPNIVYVGDGETDVPCFRLVKDLGGLSIVVFRPRNKSARDKANNLIRDGRAHCLAPADYRDDKELDRIVKAQIDLVAGREARDQRVARNQPKVT